jgi:hypothetical protein
MKAAKWPFYAHTVHNAGVESAANISHAIHIMQALSSLLGAFVKKVVWLSRYQEYIVPPPHSFFHFHT